MLQWSKQNLGPIDSCDGFKIKAEIAPSPQGCKPYKYIWAFSTSSLNTSSATLLEEAIDGAAEDSEELDIPANLLDVGSSYNFTFTIQNVNGVTSTRAYIIIDTLGFPTITLSLDQTSNLWVEHKIINIIQFRLISYWKLQKSDNNCSKRTFTTLWLHSIHIPLVFFLELLINANWPRFFDYKYWKFGNPHYPRRETEIWNSIWLYCDYSECQFCILHSCSDDKFHHSRWKYLPKRDNFSKFQCQS